MLLSKYNFNLRHCSAINFLWILSTITITRRSRNENKCTKHTLYIYVQYSCNNLKILSDICIDINMLVVNIVLVPFDVTVINYDHNIVFFLYILQQ